jgi:mitochondrial fission protein ELM1
MTERIWVLADPRAGTAAQALGIAEALSSLVGEPFRTLPLGWSRWVKLPLPLPTLAGLSAETQAAFAPPWPQLVISAGRRAAPAALWLGARGAATVHCMRPGFGTARFSLLVLGQHDQPRPAANVIEVLGATHRMNPARLAAARAEWAALAALPAPRVALLVGGPVKREGEGLDHALVAGLAQAARGLGGSVLATSSRRTGAAASAALAQALAGAPHRLFRWGDAGPNPYAGFLAWADAVVVTGDSVSMLSEALATPAPVFIAELPAGRRQRLLWQSLYAAGQARPLGAAPFTRAPLDETARVAARVSRLLEEPGG